MANPKKSNSLFWGVILIVVGALFLLNELHIDVWRLWPVVLIIWGADKVWLGLKDKDVPAPAPHADKTHEI